MRPDEVPDTELHRLLGAHPMGDGQARFCVWSANHDEIILELKDSGRQFPMSRLPGGYFIATVDDLLADQNYFFRVDGGPPRPDPASRFQPHGVHGPSQIVDSTFPWADDDWQGVDQDDLIIYELHVGTFTQRGTFTAAIERLDELVDLGVTAIELMPVAACPGKWNWGYDGVHWFAPSVNYGSPRELRMLVDSAHAKGLAVILDVVYNHFGPEGNYLAEFGPYLSSKHTTPWGAAPNFDDPRHARQLRRFVVANAIHWLDEYHFDGLRVDAIHCMMDDSDSHVAVQISEAVHQWSLKSGRSAMLIAESNVYDSNMLAPRAKGGIGFDAEWCDDFLHSVYAVIRPGEHRSDRVYEPKDLKQTLEYGFVFEGALTKPRWRHTPSQRVDTSGLVYAIQTHDFVGNHPLGTRLHQIAGKDAHRAAAAFLIFAPAIPMLFMGEEFACEHPFQFFVDFGDPSMREAVAQGRKSEYPQHDWNDGSLPTSPTAFTASKIGEAGEGDPEMRTWYRQLLALRKRYRKEGLIHDSTLQVHTDPEVGLYRWQYSAATAVLTVAVRLNPNSGGNPLPTNAPGNLMLDSRSDTTGTDLFPNHAKIFLKKS